MRALLLLALLAGCADPPPGGSPVPAAPKAPAPGPTAARPPLPTWSRELLHAADALLHHLESPAPAHLDAARSALERALRRRPALTFERLLLARVMTEQGKPEEARAALSAVHPDRRVLYGLLLDRPLAELAPYLRGLRWRSCAAGGRADCGESPPLPADMGVWEQVAAVSHAADRLAQWTAGAGRPDVGAFLERVGVRPGLRVADVGAGEGYFTVPIARAVESGRVWAVELDPAYTAHQTRVAEALGLPNLQPVLGRSTDAGLPAGEVDLVFVCEVWKAVSDHRRARDPAHYARDVEPWLRSLHRALAPGGRLVVVDHDLPPTDLDAAGFELVRDQAERAGFRFVERVDDWGPMQFVGVWER